MIGRTWIIGAAAAVSAALSLAGCATADEASSATVAAIQPTSYVVKDLVTTTTTTTPPTTTTIPGMIYEAYTHTISQGDNPSVIADRYSISLQALNEANATNPDYSAFPIGGTVIIPPGAMLPTGAGTTGGGAQQDASGCTTQEHVVAEGDNPTVVANKYGVSIEDLARANATNPVYQSFVLGGTLAIPVGNC
jgi:LysM repeat protein